MTDYGPYYRERLFNRLVFELHRDLKGVQYGGAIQLVKHGTTEPSTHNGEAQSARCIYCLKTIASWGATKGRGKKHNKRLEKLKSEHVDACAERWTWGVLARWALGESPEAEMTAVDAWSRELRSLRGIVCASRNIIEFRALVDVLAMFGRLPSRDPQVIQAIELFVQSCHRYVGGFGLSKEDGASYEPFVHGTTPEHPHVFLPTKLADAEYGCWGACPCGVFEFRGDMALDEQLIGWRGQTERAMSVGRFHPHARVCLSISNSP